MLRAGSYGAVLRVCRYRFGQIYGYIGWLRETALLQRKEREDHQKGKGMRSDVGVHGPNRVMSVRDSERERRANTESRNSMHAQYRWRVG
jgi:hypothetical protein